jgi:hypothetical protein
MFQACLNEILPLGDIYVSGNEPKNLPLTLVGFVPDNRGRSQRKSKKNRGKVKKKFTLKLRAVLKN